MTTASFSVLNRRIILTLVLMSALAYHPLSALADEPEEEKQIESPGKTPPAPAAKPAQGNAAATVLPETSVSSSRIQDEHINKTQSITKITAEDLERRQVSTVFDAVRNTPGVSIDGGPRLNGMSFNIRGFESSDVAVSVDGVLKNYSKYRSKGTYIEPDLLKTIEIRRGPQINTNSGYIGGAVITRTKDAEDFLRPGQTAGARIKFGYGNNNDEYLRSYLAYARPHERIDLIYNYTNRQSNDMTLGNGDKFGYSNINTVSELFKITLYPVDSLRVSTSLAKLKQAPTAQLYDTITDLIFSTPYVLRAIDEETISQTWEFTPDNQWINLKASIGTGHTKQDETTPHGWVGNNGSGMFDFGDRIDTYSFKNTNVDLANTANIFTSKDLNLALLIGIQYAKQETITHRTYTRPNAVSAVMVDNNPTPSALNTSTAFYIQPTIQIKRLTITPGYRKDYTSLEALDQYRQAMDAAKQRHEIQFREEIYNLALAFDILPENLTVFANYGQGFSPIRAGSAFILGPIVAGVPSSQSLCPRDYSSCDDTYRPQRVESTEAGINYATNHLFGQPIQLTSKATFYHIHTSNAVMNAGNPQYLTQRRNGWEFENHLNYKQLYMQASYSRIAGSVSYPNTNASRPLYTIPGNAFNLTLGANIGKNFDINLNYRRVSDRLYLNGLSGATARFATQDGYELFNAGIRWSPNQHLTFRLVGENLGDKEYTLDGGFSGNIGLPGPGRNIKFYTELIY